MATPIAEPLVDQAITDRATINRANAEHSTGPRTVEGKDRVRLNATKHGMYSKEIVLPGEDLAAYVRLGTQLTATHNPKTDEALALVQILQDTEWRIDRLIALDFNLHALGAAEQLGSIDPAYAPAVREALAQAAAYRVNARVFDQLSRHENRLRRLYTQTLAQLTAQPAQPKPQNGFVPNVVEIGPPTEPTVAPIAPRLPKMPKFSGPMKNVDRKNWLRKHGISETRA